MITHDPEIAAIADRVVRIEDGRIAGDTLTHSYEQHNIRNNSQRRIQP